MPRTLVTVHAKPRSKEPGIEVAGGVIVIRVREAPHDGKANEACRALLARAARVRPSAVILVRGARSKIKLFAIDGIERFPT